MKRVKRKYTRHNKVEVLPDVVQSNNNPPKEESGTIPRFGYNDLPPSIQGQVERQINYRKKLGLPDDSKERKAIAVKMFKGERPR